LFKSKSENFSIEYQLSLTVNWILAWNSMEGEFLLQTSIQTWLNISLIQHIWLHYLYFIFFAFGCSTISCLTASRKKQAENRHKIKIDKIRGHREDIGGCRSCCIAFSIEYFELWFLLKSHSLFEVISCNKIQ
jgi:hypothetical protein